MKIILLTCVLMIISDKGTSTAVWSLKVDVGVTVGVKNDERVFVQE